MNPKTLASLAALAAFSLPVAAWATNGYQLIGVGAYQKSLGGAVTANPGSAAAPISRWKASCRRAASTSRPRAAIAPRAR
jgi:hypothetical protein